MAEVDYLKVLKTAEEFTSDLTPWDLKFKNLVATSIKEQADAFKLRFALQFEKQGINSREMVHKINAVREIFIEKSKSGNGKMVKYGSVEFGDIIKEHGPDSQMTFMERKDKFKDFDLDGNGYVDICEFLLYLYKDTVINGFYERTGSKELGDQTEAQALIKEFVNISILVNPKLDNQITEIAKCKSDFEKDMQKIKDDAKSEIKKRQLANTLKSREAKHEDDLKNFWTDQRIEKAKRNLLKAQEKHLKEIEASLDQEASDALKPKKNLKIPGNP